MKLAMKKEIIAATIETMAYSIKTVLQLLFIVSLILKFYYLNMEFDGQKSISTLIQQNKKNAINKIKNKKNLFI